MTQTIIDIAAHDALKAGDRVTLERHFPAGYNGPNSPASTFRATFTLRKIQRLADWGGQPNWYAEGVEADYRGCWAIGRVPGGLVTTLTAVKA